MPLRQRLIPVLLSIAALCAIPAYAQEQAQPQPVQEQVQQPQEEQPQAQQEQVQQPLEPAPATPEQQPQVEPAPQPQEQAQPQPVAQPAETAPVQQPQQEAQPQPAQTTPAQPQPQVETQPQPVQATPVQQPAQQQAPLQPAQAIPADRTINLREAIDYGLGRHPRIKQAESNVTVGKYRVLESQSALWPFINFQASNEYFAPEQGISGASAIGGTPSLRGKSPLTTLSFVGNWTVFDFGRTYYAIRNARELEKAVQEDLSTTEQGVAYDVMDSYFNLLKAQSLVKVAQDTLDNANSHLDQAKAFYEVGVKPKYDVTQAEVQVNNAKVLLVQAEDAVTAARINLNTRLAVDPMSPTTVADVPELEKLDKTLEGYMQDALANRPELKGLQDRLRASEMSFRAQVSDYLPTLSVRGSYTWEKNPNVDFQSSKDLLLLANVPLFSGFLTTARVGQARATVNATKYQIEDTKLSMLNQVSQAYLSLQDAKARTEGLQVTVRSARENLDIAQGRYEAGVGAILDVTDAQVSLTSAEANLAQAFYDYHLAYSSLLRSTGKSPR